MRTGPALLVLFLVSFSPVCRAQSTNASLNGRVSDPSKAPIANAKLVAINTATNSHFETATNTAGDCYLTNLPPGPYRLEIEKTGFKKLIKPDVTLHVQDALEIDFELTLGEVSESVTGHIRTVYSEAFDGLSPVGRFRHQFHIRFGIDQGRDPLAEERWSSTVRIRISLGAELMTPALCEIA